jgi:hypothetical protein
MKKKYTESGSKRLLRVLITPAQDKFLHEITMEKATTESEVVRTALNRMMHDQFGIQVPV